MSLQTVAQPTAEPVTLDQVKAALRISSTADDALIQSYITPARVFAEMVTKKSLVTKTYMETRERFPWPHRPIVLPMPPVSAVLSITFLDETGMLQTWDPVDYLVGLNQVPAIIIPANGYVYPSTFFADGYNSVNITFTAGPGTGAFNMDSINLHLEGVRQLAAHFYSHPEAVNSENLKEMPLGIQTLLGAGKVYVF